MKILIADDDLTCRILLQELLASYGEVHTCISGTEAVELFAHAQNTGKPYDVVCLDIMMPHETGLDALTRIRKMEESVNRRGRDGSKILMITALDDSRSIMTAFRNMCDGYVRKPIDAAALLRQIEQIAGVQRV